MNAQILGAVQQRLNTVVLNQDAMIEAINTNANAQANISNQPYTERNGTKKYSPMEPFEKKIVFATRKNSQSDY